MSKGKRIIVAMSGGIDSSVAALLLKKQGYDCIGVFMRNWDMANEAESSSNVSKPSENSNSPHLWRRNKSSSPPSSSGDSDRFMPRQCSIETDLRHMKQVCAHLNIPAFEVDFVKEYWNRVFVPFIETFTQPNTYTRTPNPDVYCNRHVKFNCFLEFVKQRFHVTTFATGHYARLQYNQPGDMFPKLLRAVDDTKDQSYFLSMTQADALRHVVFPIGHLRKTEVKEIAAKEFAGCLYF